MHAPHQEALRQALAWLPEIAPPAGIVVSGSIVRGNPHPNSDFDIVILHDGAWRRRVQRWFNGTPAELFFNSEAWLRHAVHSEAAGGRPVMAHMLATGTVVQDSDGRMAAIVDHARTVLERGPCLSADALLRDRYMAATLVEDALDLSAAPSSASSLASEAAHQPAPASAAGAMLAQAAAVDALIRHAYLSANRFLPRPKERLALLEDRPLAELLATALASTADSPSAAADALRQASERVLGVSGFFAWDSGPDHAQP